MASELPTNFTQPPAQAIASYDYTDLVENIGVRTFYGGSINVSGSETYRLDTNTFDPWHVDRNDGDEQNTGRYTIATFSSTSDTIQLDLDFDTSPFKLPKDLNGTLMVNIPYAQQYAASDVKVSAFVNVFVKRVRSGVETTIASGTSPTQLNNNDGTAVDDGMFSFPITITNEHFKKDDVLRITLEVHAWKSTGTAGTQAFMLMHDPLARDVAVTGGASVDDTIAYSGGRPLTFYIPFKITA